jgi:hypothetical protein
MRSEVMFKANGVQTSLLLDESNVKEIPYRSPYR